MRRYFFARCWSNGDEVLELLESSFLSYEAFKHQIECKYPHMTVVVDELTLREFLFLGRKFEDHAESQERIEEACHGA